MTEARTLQTRVWRQLNPRSDVPWTQRVLMLVINALIVVAVLKSVVASVPEVRAQYRTLFGVFEFFFTVIFTIEYAARIWAAGADERYQGFVGRLRWMVTPWALVDLVALAPAFMIWADVDLRVVRAVRLLRLLRLGRSTRTLALLGQTFRQSVRPLSITLSCVIVLLLCTAAVMYYVERDAQPVAFGSIPAAMWWAVCTLTTVGYGDVYPVTTLGKAVAGTIAILGMGTFAIPAGIVAANLEQALKGPIKCPRCGEVVRG